jgi:hypothetical protein
MKNLCTALLAVLFLTACGDGDFHQSINTPQPSQPTLTPTPTPTPAPVVDEVQQDIDLIIEEENQYRLALGQQALTPGLSCSVVKITSGTCLFSNSPGVGCSNTNVINVSGQTVYNYSYVGSFAQEEGPISAPNLLLPPALRPLFINQNHRIICTGFIVARQSGYYGFSLTSDDASVLIINNAQVINHDNAHAMTEKFGVAFLRRGVTPIAIHYAQTTGPSFGLILKSGGEVVKGRYFYR